MLPRLVTLAVISLFLATGSAPAAAEPATFGWPLAPRPIVVAPFAPPEHDWLPGHRGVDLAGTAGQTVFAGGDGVVIHAGPIADRPVVSIEHDGGLRTTYEPVEPVVRRGDRVRRGDPIGVLNAGHEGCSASACLHWGARRGRDYVDPLGLLALGPLVLKPVVRTSVPGAR